ncbi:MAG: hypothetical protein U0996_10810 [Planctomycetaceae bacterium]
MAVSHQAGSKVVEAGSTLLKSVFVLQIGLNLLLIFNMISREMTGEAVGTIARFVIELIMMAAIFRGGEFIRTLWVFGLLLGLILLGRHAIAGPDSLRFIVVPMMLLYCYMIYVLRFSPAVDAYLASLKETHGDLR